MEQTLPLTGTGIGIMLKGLLPGEVPEHAFIEDLILKYGFVVIKNLNLPIEDVQDWMSGFGELVRNEKRVKETVLVLDGQKDDKEVLGGKGRMPLHCDGLLMNENVRLVGIYGVDFDITEGGQTFIADNEAAWDRIPEHIKEAFKQNGIAVMPCDTAYYIKNETKWYHFPGIQTRGEKEYINGGLHYHPDERPSYLIKIPHISEEMSNEYYNLMEKLYHDESMIYYHTWDAGDLLLMDNVRTMHGRQSFSGKRSIAQFQVRNTK